MSNDVGFLEDLRTRSTVRAINRFLTTPGYILGVLFLVMLANDAAIELQVYTALLCVGCYICLFADDLLPLMPILTGCYISVSARNNPGLHQDAVFFTQGLSIFIMVVPFVLCLIYRLCTDKKIGAKAFLTKKRRLLPGMLLLGVAYVLGGLLSPAYPGLWKKSLLFGLLQFAAVAVPYYVFSGAVDWKKAPKDYFPWIGFLTGCMLVLQILRIYFHRDVIVDGVIIRDRIFTGWGMYNNIGCFLAMMIPFAFYLASRYNKGWIGSVVGSAFLVGVFFTCSRGAILMGSAVYLLCIILLMLSAKNKKGNTVAVVLFLSALLLAVILFHRQIYLLFRSVLDRGFDPNNRNHIYAAGWKQFLQSPVFGGSFYPIGFEPYDWSTVPALSSFLPPRWHNTFIQLLACTGVVGLLAYGFHRYETVRMFLRDRTREKAFIACSVAVLLGCSLVDCHFFNLGPVLFYSAGLAFAEQRANPQ